MIHNRLSQPEEMSPGELRAYLVAALKINSPPLNATDAISLGQIESFLWDRAGRNLFELYDLTGALIHHLWRDAPAHSWFEVDKEQIDAIVDNPELIRVALLRCGVYAQVDSDSGRVIFSSAPRGIGAHRVRRVDFDGLWWNGRDLLPEEDA